MAFSFGAPKAAPPPATAGGGGGSSGNNTTTAAATSTGGFSFGGGSTTNNNTSTTTSSTTMPSTGLFGGAATSTNNNNSSKAAPTGGGLFGAAPPSATKTTTTANAPASQTIATAKEQPNKSIATIPKYTTRYPRLQIQRVVENALVRYKTNNNNGNDSSSSFAVQEFIELLRVEDNNTNSNNEEGGVTDNTPVGKYLSNPTSIVTFTPPPSLTTSTNTPLNNNNDNNVLRQKLLQAASNKNNNNTTSQDSSAVYITLNDQLTIITPQIAHDILQLSDGLYISEMDSLALYSEAMAIISSSHDGGGSGGSMNVNEGEEEGGGGEGGISESQYEFVKMLIKGGKVGYDETDNNNQTKLTLGSQPQSRGQQQFNPSNQPQQQQGGGSWMTQGQQQQSTTTIPKQTFTSSTNAIVKIAQSLYFQERSALLTTLSDLIRHRVEAADELTSTSSTMNGNNNNGGGRNNKNAVLIATDQLINSGLISNLITSVKELTDNMKDIRERLDGKKKQQKQQQQQQQQVQQQPTMGMFGTPSPAVAPSISNNLNSSTSSQSDNDNRDMDYALLGFTQLQRQIVIENLYYAAYHTQLTAEEVCALIDLIQELTNGGGGAEEGLPILDPLIKDVPSPYYEDVDSDSSLGGGGGVVGGYSSWQQQQQQQFHIYGQQQQQQSTSLFAPPQPKLKDAQRWENELVTSLWKRGQPQLLQCVSTLVMCVVCALDARHVLVNRESHDVNAFGVGNALFPPSSSSSSSLQDQQLNNNATALLQSIHQRLDPNSDTVESSWKRRDVWGLLLVPYALLLRSEASSIQSPRGSPDPRGFGGGGGGGGVMDVKSTYLKCLMVASQLKSLTFARLSIIPSISSPLTHGGGGGASSSSSSTEFYLSTLSDLTAQYIDALGTSGNLPITRSEWYDEEVNLAQSEWMEKEQRRQFGEWAGQEQPPEDEDAESGPKRVNIMDRPDCLEDVFALVSSIVEVYPVGAKAFWYINQEVQMDEEGMNNAAATTKMVLSPSRAMQTLDLLQSDNDSSLFVYLSFLASLSLADCDGSANNGAAMVHSYLSGDSAINHGDRRMHFLWDTIMDSIRWYAEHLSPDDDQATVNEEKKTTTIRRSTDADSMSTSYYYGVGGNGGNDTPSSPLPDNRTSNQGNSSNSTATSTSKKKKELDEVGRNTLMSLLCLISNVASKCGKAREFILAIQLPALDSGSSSGSNGGAGYQDGSLEILFSLLTINTLPPDIMGMAFTAIANLLRPSDTLSAPGAPSDNMDTTNNGATRSSARRAWELLELCKFIPIKLLSQFSSYASGAGSMPNSSTMAKKQPSAVNELPANAFPKSTDYGMIYQFEHVETLLGSFPATEGFLYLLTTLIKSVGCPSNLGGQWRLRTGCGPYIEYVTDFILPRATAMEKSVRGIRFGSVSEECRLVERALEVVEAVLVRYIVPPSPVSNNTLTLKEVKDGYQRNIKMAKTEMGLSSISSDIFVPVESISEEEMNCAVQDFRSVHLPSTQDNNLSGDQMLEASFGEQVPLPKTPGFSILSNILSTDKGMLFQIIEKLLIGGSQVESAASSIHGYAESIHSNTLAMSLFRETSPTLKDAAEGTVAKARVDHNVITNRAFQATLLDVQQGMIRPLNPLLSLSYSTSGGDVTYHEASSSDAVLWKERILLLSLRILVAAAAREESFIDSLKRASGSAQLTLVPTLSFKGPIHGSYGHRFKQEQKVTVSRVSQLLTRSSSSSMHQAGNWYLEMLPTITEYIGYSSTALSDDTQSIAKASFSIVSYIAHTLPHVECVHALCGSDDVFGQRLANAFARGLSYVPESSDGGMNLQDAILDLLLEEISSPASSSNNKNLNLSFMMLGLCGGTRSLRLTSLDVVLELIADSMFILDPKTSSTATKCFELLYRVFDMRSNQTLPANVQNHVFRLVNKLRRTNFWQTQIIRYLGMQGPSTQSILHEISNSFSYEYGDDVGISSRNNDTLHSIAWLLKCVSIELYSLMGQQGKNSSDMIMSGGMTQFNNHLQSLLACLLSNPNSLLLAALVDMPLGRSSNGYIQEHLHGIAAPPRDVLKNSSRPMSGPIEVCAGYELLDIDLLCQYQNTGSEQSDSTLLQNAKEWGMAWNSFVCRVCACSNITQAWSDVIRAALLCSPSTNDLLMESQATNSFQLNTRTISEYLCTILSRLLNPSHLDALGHCVTFSQHDTSLAGIIEAECAMPLSVAALGLTEMFIEFSSGQDDIIAEEDVSRICALIVGAISSCSESSGTEISSNDGRGAVLSCALTRVLVFFQKAEYSIIPQNPGMLDIYANAVSILFRLSTSPVFDEDARYANAHEAKNGAIALAARSGLSSLFSHLKSTENKNAVSGIFCSRIFTLDTIITAIVQLARLLTCDDNDVAYLLQQISMFKDGVQVLAGAGVTGKLLEFAKAYSIEGQKYLSSHLSGELKPPKNLSGHLSLISGLLASEISDRVALATDSFELLKVYSTTYERMIQVYPTNSDVTTKFIEAMHLTYAALKDSPSTIINVDDSTVALERSVLRIVCQLSECPLPPALLPPLPMGIINVEQIHASQMRSITTTDHSAARTWWDNIPASALKDGSCPLPSPPTGSFNAANKNSFISYQKSTWSESKYQLAISAAKCLDTAISFLINRVHFVSKRDLPTFCVDAVAIAKGICRCSDASRAIHDRLNALKSHPEEDITTMLDADPLKEHDPVSYALAIERECLSQLGTNLGQCAEKLVCLALQDVRRMARTVQSSDVQQWAYFIGALKPALDHTEMEKNGSEASMTMSLSLSQEMERVISQMKLK